MVTQQEQPLEVDSREGKGRPAMLRLDQPQGYSGSALAEREGLEELHSWAATNTQKLHQHYSGAALKEKPGVECFWPGGVLEGPVWRPGQHQTSRDRSS